MQLSDPDVINALFEGAGTLFMVLTIRRLLQDKMVRGFDWRTMTFFALWAYWNMFYYPYLDQMFSYLAGLGLAASNTVYVLLMIYYILREKGRVP